MGENQVKRRPYSPRWKKEIIGTSKIPRTSSFHVVVLQRTAKKCTKNNNARAQPLFCSLNLLFCGVLVAVAVVVCLSSLFIMITGQPGNSGHFVIIERTITKLNVSASNVFRKKWKSKI